MGSPGSATRSRRASSSSTLGAALLGRPFGGAALHAAAGLAAVVASGQVGRARRSRRRQHPERSVLVLRKLAQLAQGDVAAALGVIVGLLLVQVLGASSAHGASALKWRDATAELVLADALDRVLERHILHKLLGAARGASSRRSSSWTWRLFQHSNTCTPWRRRESRTSTRTSI